MKNYFENMLVSSSGVTVLTPVVDLKVHNKRKGGKERREERVCQQAGKNVRINLQYLCVTFMSFFFLTASEVVPPWLLSAMKCLIQCK